MAEKAFLRRVVPAVPLPGHRLPQVAVFYEVDELDAGIMTALIAVNDRLLVQRYSVPFHQLLHGIQHEIHFEGFTQHMGEDLLGAGVQDRGEIAERAVHRDVGDVRQKDAAGAVFLKLALHQILRRIVRADRSLHPSVRIGLADRAEQTVFPHEPSDLLYIHPNAGMEKPHMNPTDPFVIAAKAVCRKDLPEVRLILFLPLLPRFFRAKPGIVAGS